MAARPTESKVDLAPADEPLGTEYDRDFYSWLMEQARHVRAGRWDALDRENLAEEIESLGREQEFRQGCTRCWITPRAGARRPSRIGSHRRARTTNSEKRATAQ